MKRYSVLFLAIITVHLYAQNDSKRDYTWVLGYGSYSNNQYRNTTLFFTPDSFTVNDSTSRGISFWRSAAMICDISGDLLFYTNGFLIHNAQDEMIINGQGLNLGINNNSIEHGNWIHKGDLILPIPDQVDKYILLHSAVLQPFQPVAIYQNLIDMSVNNGQGELIVANQEIVNGGYLYGGLTACRHANGRDWWILIHKYNSDCFVRLLLTPDGISIRGEQCIGLWETTEGIWDAVYSPDGSKYIYYSDTDEKICIFDFDRCNGELSNPVIFQVIPPIYSTYGIAVSPNSRFLYHSLGTELYQYDLEAADIEQSGYLVGEYDGYMSPFQQPNIDRTYFNYPQLAPNGKIYINTGNTTDVLHVIHSPNLKGDSCNFKQHDLQIALNTSAIPNFPNFRLSALSGSGCDTLTSVGEPIKDMGYASIYPNPARSDAAISWRLPSGVSAATLQITGSLGQMVCTEILPAPEGKISLPLAHLPKGMFFYRIFHSEGQLYSGKLWKE